MALMGIQEYIARDANNIANLGQYILVSHEKESSNTIIIIYIGLCVSSNLREKRLYMRSKARL